MREGAGRVHGGLQVSGSVLPTYTDPAEGAKRAMMCGGWLLGVDVTSSMEAVIW